jgi:hypothetical protein
MSTDETTTPPPAPVEPTPKATETSVSYDRFSAVNDARREAEAQIAELRAQLEQVVPIFDKVEQLSVALQTERTERQTVEVLAHHGIGDSDLRELVRWCYDRLPDEGRPTFGDAVASWRNDPEAAPLALRPHLQAPSAAAPAMPNSNAGALRQPEANGALQVRTDSGSLELHRQHRDAILRSIGINRKD